MKKKYYYFIIILLLLIAGWRIYRILMPAAPNLDLLENPLSDRSAKNWKEEEKKIVKESLKEAFFGDLHVHTKYSFDAYIGGVSAGPEEAYQFAKGEPVEVLDEMVKILKPLDFAAVTDHAEYLGEMYAAQTPGTDGYFSFPSIALRSIGKDTAKQMLFFRRLSARGHKNSSKPRNHPNFFKGYSTTALAWDEIIDAAEAHYTPGAFTTFIGYEWSKGAQGAHLHRNVIFKDAIVPNYPLSAFEARDEIKLWESLETYRSEGATVMAIPHNSNLSHGKTFADTQPDGSPINEDYVLTRYKNEPLVEIHQAKGSSEVHPAIWMEDEYADFEIYEEEEAPQKNNFVRHVLKKGLKYKSQYGVNPYEYGLIGSTDTHNGTPGNTEEDDSYQGNHLFLDTKPELRSSSTWLLNNNLRTAEAINPGGLVGVWARANTRSEIYESLTRKETFATSGNRIKVRFFGGSDFSEPFQDYKQMVANGYATGVPMGSYLKEIDNKPQFLIWAAKDPEGANLYKIQLIKGWYEDQEMKEKIIDVVQSDNEYTDVKEVIDFQTGEVDSSYGSPELYATWTDEEFDESSESFYYLRVLEVPTPRYTEWDKIRYNTKYDEDIKRTTIERAWSSPIWYSP